MNDGNPVESQDLGAFLAGDIASAEALGVVSIDAPSELASIAGAASGEMRRVHQTVAGADEWTLYAWDSASSASESTPWSLNGSSGQWRAVAGKYADGARHVLSSFSIHDATDRTKIATFVVSGITTGTTRSYTLPDVSSTVAVLGQAQTWTAAQSFTSRAAFGGGSYSADLTSIIVNRAIAITPNDHGARDESTVTVASGAGGYASYDAQVTFAGAATYDHLHAFQARQLYNGSGSLTDLVSLWSQPGHTGAGTVTNAKGVWLQDASGAGTITNNYGVYVDSLTRGGTLNYAIYTAGTTPSLFGGAVTVTGAIVGSSTLTATGLVRTTTSLFEGPAAGGFVINAYFSGGWKYRATNVAYKVQDGGSGYLVLSAAVSGTADAAITWVDSLSVGPTNIAIASATPLYVNSTVDATAVGTAALVVAGGASFGKRIILDGSTGKTLRIANATANASVATTLGSVGPTGSTAGNPQGWMRVDINGTDRYVPFW